MRDKKKIIQIITLIAIIILGAFGVLNNEVQAKKVEGTSSGWVFSNDRGSLNWDSIPSNLFAENGVILWCIGKGQGTTKYMTAAQEFDDAYENDTSSATYNGEVSWTSGKSYKISSVNGRVYAHYRRSNILGLVRNHKDTSDGVSYNNTLAKAKAVASSAGCCGVVKSYAEYEGDDQTIIDSIKSVNGLPGMGDNPTVQAINYVGGNTLETSSNQAALFVLTALRKYGPGETSLSAESLTEEELKEGGFNVVEKQYALWELDVNKGRRLDTNYDRGLGEISKQYQEFYNTIHNEAGEDKYEDIVNASSGYDENGNAKTENIEETKETIDGKEYKTYKYKDTVVEQDTSAKCYVLGPFAIDYTANDEKLDTYNASATYYKYVADRNDEEEIEEGAGDETEDIDSYAIKFNAIQNVTVYNQDKVDITTLGGYFKLAYGYTGTNSDGTISDEAKITRINNKTYVTEDTILDGEEISGVDSKKEFYIIVYRGNMEPEEFTGFYAKFDFEYLESITGTMREYIGNVYNYYYEENQNFGTYTYTYSSSVAGRHSHTRGGHCHSPTKISSYTVSIAGYSYNLKKEKSGSEAQIMLGYSGDGERHYKTYSIVITSDWTTPYKPEFELYKKCTEGEALYGAKFKITANVEGTDIFENEIEEEVIFTEKTGTDGIIDLTTTDFRQEGVELGTFTGTVTLTFEETRAPAGHSITQKEYEMIAKIEKGKIVSVNGDNVIYDSESNKATLTVYNEEAGTPKIQIAKVDSDGNLIEEAYFEVHVSYTEPGESEVNGEGTEIVNYGELIDKKGNIIRGQTKNGVMDLTVEDFANMKYGFDIEGYTGKITLDIVEVAVDGAYSLSSDSREITLEYINGNLIDYSEFTNKEVNITYLYDSVKDNVYKYITGEIKYNDLNAYVQNYLEDWVKKQEKNRPDMTYDDILAWLKKYIDENGDDVMEATTKLTTETLSRYKDVVQVTVEDSIGDLPDIPDIPEKVTPEPDPLFMTVAGKVFLDETETKEAASVSDGKLGDDEELLQGIEVTLYETDGTLATLVQSDESKARGEIRTNPTITDENGYYEFMGVDPFKEYYVVFTYNGIEYTTTVSGEATYNSDEWSVTSKGSELTSARSTLNANYSEIGSTTIAYDYYALQGTYTEIATRVQSYINTNNAYPSMDSICNEVIAFHKDDDEIAKKIEYIKNSQISAYAGYSSKDGGISSETANGIYPYYNTGRFISNENFVNNANDTEVEFAKDTVKLLQPGQSQVHLGLVERDSTDLELQTDIVNTRVSMNGYDTQYDLEQGLSSYSQYIYEEDYNYSKTENTDGVAYYTKAGTNILDNGVYYTEDQVEYYMTYKTTIKNATLTPTAVVEVAEYYNNKFSWANSYTTSKGNVLAGYSVTLNGTDVTGSVTINTENSRYGKTSIDTANTSYVNAKTGEGYKELFVRFNNGYMLTDGDVLNIYLTFKMDSASATLYNEIYTGKGTADYSKLWQIGNYAEINGYMTEGGYLDSDSRPGNFVIEDYENAKLAYQEAYSNYVNNKTEDNARKLKLALGRLTEVREDDAWYVGMTLANTGYTRELHGSVWEAITNEVNTSTDLQAENSELLTYIQENGLKHLSVELVELTDDCKQIVRGKTTTGDNGDYTFTSYIPGNYVVRFIYGETENVKGETINDIRSEMNVKSTTSAGDTLEVNGQYYQSTKANADTDKDMYWYATDAAGSTRYSDAYDDAYSRVNQINATIENTESSTSSDYEYDGVMEVQTYAHKDTIYAYTSTLNLEVEYIRREIEGNCANTSYEYKIQNVDFGLTPRAITDINIDKYVSYINIYTQDGTLQLAAKLDKDRTVDPVYENDQIYTNIVLRNYSSSTYKDGLIEALFDETLLNGATLEITYTITVSNDGEYDTIKYIYNSEDQGDPPVAIAYYGEEYTTLTSYEGDRGKEEGSSETYSNTPFGEVTIDQKNGIKEVYRDQVRGSEYIVYHAGNGEGYTLENYKSENKIDITTSATNIVDYIDPNLNFTQVDKLGNEINKDWELTTTDEVNTYRNRNDKTIMSKYNTIIRAAENNKLHTALLPGESAETTLTLTKVLGTTSTDTNDYEYSNLIELVKVHNDAGRITEIEQYDSTGTTKPETSKGGEENDWPKPSELRTSEGYYPTISTSKSETVTIHQPTGLNISEQAQSYLGIILVVLVILAGGVFLIKKFVLKPKTE